MYVQELVSTFDNIIRDFIVYRGRVGLVVCDFPESKILINVFKCFAFATYQHLAIVKYNDGALALQIHYKWIKRIMQNFNEINNCNINLLEKSSLLGRIDFYTYLCAFNAMVMWNDADKRQSISMPIAHTSFDSLFSQLQLAVEKMVAFVK